MLWMVPVTRSLEVDSENENSTMRDCLLEHESLFVSYATNECKRFPVS